MLPEFIRFCILLVSGMALVTLFTLFCAYSLGNTQELEEEEWDGPWGKGIRIVQSTELDLFDIDAVAQQKGLRLDGTSSLEAVEK